MREREWGDGHQKGGEHVTRRVATHLDVHDLVEDVEEGEVAVGRVGAAEERLGAQQARRGLQLRPDKAGTEQGVFAGAGPAGTEQACLGGGKGSAGGTFVKACGGRRGWGGPEGVVGHGAECVIDARTVGAPQPCGKE